MGHRSGHFRCVYLTILFAIHQAALVFRLCVPRALRALTQRSVIEHALRTTDAHLAQQQAHGLAPAMPRFSSSWVGKGRYRRQAWLLGDGLRPLSPRRQPDSRERVYTAKEKSGVGALCGHSSRRSGRHRLLRNFRTRTLHVAIDQRAGNDANDADDSGNDRVLAAAGDSLTNTPPMHSRNSSTGLLTRRSRHRGRFIKMGLPQAAQPPCPLLIDQSVQ